MLDKRTSSHIARELDQLARLMRDYGVLLAVPSEPEPGLIERTALSAVLQSFYNGVESIFHTVAKQIDQGAPAGVDWHRQLLTQMAQAMSARPALITSGTADRLEPYLGFRHLARHTYSFGLDWTRMAGLVGDLASVWAQFYADIQAFLEHRDDPKDAGV